MPSSDIPYYMWWHRCSFVPLRPVYAEFELSLTAVGAKPSGRDVQGQSVCQRRPGSQVKHTVRVVPPASFLVSVPIMSGIRARPPSCSVRVCSSGGVKPEGHRGAVIYAHPRYRAHRAAAQSHRATWPVVPEVGRGWHRAVICRDAGKSTPGPPRRALFAPHPKVSAKMGGGVAERVSRIALRRFSSLLQTSDQNERLNPRLSSLTKTAVSRRRNSPFSWSNHGPKVSIITLTHEGTRG
ncbi:hypothetical protein DPX16_11734 [Anabarilius grahami]|uniref:Uncharacterized protein n=1 Tax=Anabarilius grahami TaxID=495550 RepID=A0A3N0Z7Y0_ANAGA|nr:hypothetical protein DPX16_11734 [Anabarilius grahami]